LNFFLKTFSVVGTTSYRLDGPRFEFIKWHRILSSPKPFILALEPTEAPVQKVPEFFPRSKAARK